HDDLWRQDQDLLAQVHAVQDQVEAAAHDLQVAQNQNGNLNKSLQEITLQLTQGQETVKVREMEVDRQTAQTRASQQELTRLTADLVQLEQTLADLKALRARDKQKYSLVPYKGRRGDNRRPLYLECTASGLVFHPDRLTLEGANMSAQNIRTEVEKRLARRRGAGTAANGKDDQSYLLMLVRPTGIETYYQTLAALEGVKVDFGYEMIEPDWVLDFPEHEDAIAPQPWMSVGRPKASSPPAPGKPVPPPVSVA